PAPRSSASLAVLAAHPMGKGFLAEAEAGNPAAMAIVARMLESGTGVPDDHADAAVWYARSARAGHAEGRFAYGRLLLDRGDWREAVEWLDRAGREGNASAQRLLGAALRDGTMGVPVDLPRAVTLLEAALRAENP